MKEGTDLEDSEADLGLLLNEFLDQRRCRWRDFDSGGTTAASSTLETTSVLGFLGVVVLFLKIPELNRDRLQIGDAVVNWGPSQVSEAPRAWIIGDIQCFLFL